MNVCRHVEVCVIVCAFLNSEGKVFTWKETHRDRRSQASRVSKRRVSSAKVLINPGRRKTAVWSPQSLAAEADGQKNPLYTPAVTSTAVRHKEVERSWTKYKGQCSTPPPGWLLSLRGRFVRRWLFFSQRVNALCMVSLLSTTWQKTERERDLAVGCYHSLCRLCCIGVKSCPHCRKMPTFTGSVHLANLSLCWCNTYFRNDSK